jgi:hypothetical protein
MSRVRSRSSAAPELPPKTSSATEDAFLPAMPGRADARHRPHRSLSHAGAARRTTVRGVGRLPARYQRPCRCPSTAWSMPPSAPAPAGPSIAARGAAPAGRGASVVRSSAAAAGRRAPYGLAAGAQAAAAAHTTATPPAARTAGTSLAINLRHGPALRLPGVNNIVTPSKASRHPRDQGRKPSERVHLAGPSAPRATRESVSVSGIPRRRTIPSEHAQRRHLGRAVPRVAG